MKKQFLLFLLLLGIFSLSALRVPKLKARVNDYANVLTANEEDELERMLKSIEDKTSSQVAVLIINSLEGSSIEDYSIRVVENWKLGQRDRDNGVLLLIAMKDKKIRIEVGYGLEDVLTDLESGYIIQRQIVPKLRSNDVFGGIYQGVKSIGGIIANEYIISEKELAKYQKTTKRKKKSGSPIGTIFFLLMFFVFARRGSRRSGGILPWLLLSAMSGSSHRSSGFGGGSGFSGGGFGGFSGGGGGFGGGGASGGW